MLLSLIYIMFLLILTQPYIDINDGLLGIQPVTGGVVAGLFLD